MIFCYVCKLINYSISLYSKMFCFDHIENVLLWAISKMRTCVRIIIREPKWIDTIVQSRLCWIYWHFLSFRKMCEAQRVILSILLDMLEVRATEWQSWRNLSICHWRSGSHYTQHGICHTSLYSINLFPIMNAFFSFFSILPELARHRKIYRKVSSARSEEKKQYRPCYSKIIKILAHGKVFRSSERESERGRVILIMKLCLSAWFTLVGLFFFAIWWEITPSPPLSS